MTETLSSRVYIKRKDYLANLNNELLTWSRYSAKQENDHRCHSLKLKRILAIIPDESHQPITQDIEMNLLNVKHHHQSFYLHIIVKRNNHKWGHSKVMFTLPTVEEGSKWFGKIHDVLKGFNRPKRLLVFVNPYGGRRQGPKIFKTKVKPLFDLVGMETTLIETERANHAKDHLLNEDNNLSEYDGIISVGGDGMFSEILNGVLMRGNQTISSNGYFNPTKSSIKLGIIPAGSTDCVCYCTTGTIDVVTSAIQIITGESQPLDISSIRSENELLRYSVSFAGYGFFGDVVKDSESLRWAGVKRYDISGAKIFLENRSYEGELSYLISSDSKGHPQDNKRCRIGCTVCFPPPDAQNGDIMPAETCGWHNIIGRFISVMGATNCCANKKSPEGISPSAHLADGFIDLIVVRHTSRVRYLQHMLRLAGRSDHMDFDFVEVHRVKEFAFRPLSLSTNTSEYNEKNEITSNNTAPHSVWNVDGEIIDEPAIHVRVHHQLITLFARGIEDCETRRACSVCK